VAAALLRYQQIALPVEIGDGGTGGDAARTRRFRSGDSGGEGLVGSQVGDAGVAVSPAMALLL
jgi:hypothetical protein